MGKTFQNRMENSGQEIEPEPYWLKASAPTTAPSLISNGNERGDPPPSILLHFCHLLDRFQLRVKFHGKFMRNDITRESPEAKATPMKAKRLSENLLN